MFYKNRFMYTLGLAFLAIIIAGCSAIPSLSAQAGTGPSTVQSGGGGASALVQTSTSSTQGITVVGTGKASGTPDMATVTVGVMTQGASVQAAVTDNQTKMNALLDALKALGIASNDLRTSNYNVSSIQPPTLAGTKGSGADNPVTYQVSNQVLVTVRDISKLGSVLDKSVASGANTIYGVDFGISDPSKLQATAESNAVQDAKSRAENLAKLEGVTLGSLVSVSENSSSPVTLPAGAFGIGGGGTPIQPGQLDVTVSLQVTYTIK
jgi:uncharacterized protein YggE